MMDDQTFTETTTIIEALSTLTPSQLSDLTHTVSSLFHLLNRRLYSILSVPTLFNLTLHHLQSLPLQHKSLLIARHLLSNLTILTHLIQSRRSPHSACNSLNLRDLDAVVVLLLLCEIRQIHPQVLESPPSHWRSLLLDYVSDDLLKLSGIEVSGAQVLIKYVEMVTKCRRYIIGAMASSSGKAKMEAATSVAVVVALPSVEVSSGCRVECAICKEDMREGRDVCRLPCDHLFHWMCILPWLKKKNTCPCCRYRLPTDDVFGEIERLWELLAKIGGAWLLADGN
ncbi:hypothetical protein ACH5RR_005396 [Cinchona calisaya]|uniref:RING-type domain-containing protein n=1 Tax=Cinchona calisaya TaxID=153742 RepID=A0ABD3AL01_9GENT